MTRRAVIYARISVAQDTSVSIARQLDAAEQYAKARSWDVVGTFVDDGVSATLNKPEARAGWAALLASPEPFDVAIIWKVDRLARNTLDFLQADQALRERGAAVVSVEDNIDMTTTSGELMATMLAAFARAEARAISDRVRAARTHLVTKEGRVVGGALPYGWHSIQNPDGPGRVLATDPERIEYVRGMVERVQRGGSIYSVVQWLDEVGAPLPSTSQRNRKNPGWRYKTVESLLRNPVLAGMRPLNPGNTSKERGQEVVRGSDGLPIVDESISIMTPPDWRAMVKALDERDSPQACPRALRSKTSALLSGLVVCGECSDKRGEAVRMHRGTTQGRESYSCPKCHQTLSKFQDYVVETVLEQKGDWPRWSVVETVYEGGAAVLPEIEHRLSELGDQLQATDNDDEADEIAEQMSNLRRMRREARATQPTVEYRPVRSGATFAQDWAAASDVQAQREVLDDALEAVYVRRGRTGRGLDTSRLAFAWKHPDELGPWVEPSQEELAAWAEDEPGARG